MQTTSTGQEWQAPDGETFPYSFWSADLPEGQRPTAAVVAVHGLSGAALDFEPLGSHLARHRIATFAPELRGQGNDPILSRRGDLERIDDWLRDLSAFFLLVRSRYPDTPIFYYGESMGAALLTRFLAQALELEQPTGLILASPVVALQNRPSWWQEQFFRFFIWARPTHRVDVRKYTKRNRDEPSKWVTRDEAHRRWYETASHRILRFTVRFFKCLRDLIEGCSEAAPKIRIPALVIYAANDVFIAPKLVEQFFERLGSQDKELRLFPESYHLLLHDDDKAEVLACIESWLLRRIKMAAVKTPSS
ncbi:lysophospholipase [Methylacidiphilales bacterium]|nr:lysophospholipase [Candidatus Methylacidiphilales bacterium]